MLSRNVVKKYLSCFRIYQKKIKKTYLQSSLYLLLKWRKHMKNKLLIAGFILIVLLAFVGSFAFFANGQPHFETATVTAKAIASQISAPGTIHSINEATLHFQT